MSRAIKIWVGIIKERLSEVVNIREEQFRFMSGRSVTNAIFALGQHFERCRDGQQNLNCVFH